MSKYSLYVLLEWWKSRWIIFKRDKFYRFLIIRTEYLELAPVLSFCRRFYLGFPLRFCFRLHHFGAVNGKYVINGIISDKDGLDMREIMSNFISPRVWTFSWIAKLILQVFIWQCNLKFHDFLGLLLDNFLQFGLQFSL